MVFLWIHGEPTPFIDDFPSKQDLHFGHEDFPAGYTTNHIILELLKEPTKKNI